MQSKSCASGLWIQSRSGAVKACEQLQIGKARNAAPAISPLTLDSAITLLASSGTLPYMHEAGGEAAYMRSGL